MSRRPSLFVFLAFSIFATVASLGSAIASGSVGDQVASIRALSWRIAERTRALSPSLTRISPDRGQFRLDLAEAMRRRIGERKALITEIFEDLERGKPASCNAFASAVSAVHRADPARRFLLSIASSLASRLRGTGPAALGRADRLRLLASLDSLRAKGKDITPTPKKANPTCPIYIAFHWHMHQPIYWPCEDLVKTQEMGVYSFNLYDIFHSRRGAYTDWPYNAVRALADGGVPGGAQVSFSGSLIENLNTMVRVRPDYKEWWRHYTAGRRMKTAGGNPRLDLVAFGFHHPLMALIGYEDIRRQIASHRKIQQQRFGKDVPYSKGIFPPENAFAAWMIPALVDEGIEWAFVDNIHFDRACKGYPWVKGENLMPPNPADQRNSDPGGWKQLNGLWAPSKVSAWSNRPHWVVHRDSETGEVARTPDGKVARMIAVPTDRYMGNEDGRGGFGALNYDAVMSQLEDANDDGAHPLLIVLHHDGDNYGGGSYGYYHDNFRRFVAWLKANPHRFVCTTVQDYLDRFPPAADDVIYVEPGSWAGADNGDAEFLKWNGDPDPETGYSPDRNSWGVMTAARNLVAEARAVNLPASVVAKAERYLMVAQTSCYEYWDGTEMWDSHPTRACNQAVKDILPRLRKLRRKGGRDTTPPALYQPQRQPYNPGGFEWTTDPETRNVQVWTYAYDLGGVKSVALRYRVQPGKRCPADTADHCAVGEGWKALPMPAKAIPAQTNPLPLAKADEYAATITDAKDALVSYQVMAIDQAGNRTASPLLHVYVGSGQATPAGPVYEPEAPTTEDPITVWSDRPGLLHWGVNGWTLPNESHRPLGTVAWHDGKAVETPMALDEETGRYKVVLGPFDDEELSVSSLDFVMHFDDDSWGKDGSVTIGR